MTGKVCSGGYEATPRGAVLDGTLVAERYRSSVEIRARHPEVELR